MHFAHPNPSRYGTVRIVARPRSLPRPRARRPRDDTQGPLTSESKSEADSDSGDGHGGRGRGGLARTRTDTDSETEVEAGADERICLRAKLGARRVRTPSLGGPPRDNTYSWAWASWAWGLRCVERDAGRGRGRACGTRRSRVCKAAGTGHRTGVRLVRRAGYAALLWNCGVRAWANGWCGVWTERGGPRLRLLVRNGAGCEWVRDGAGRARSVDEAGAGVEGRREKGRGVRGYVRTDIPASSACPPRLQAMQLEICVRCGPRTRRRDGGGQKVDEGRYRLGGARREGGDLRPTWVDISSLLSPFPLFCAPAVGTCAQFCLVQQLGTEDERGACSVDSSVA
ncbi:hypothetical protein B0H17DRAFT_1148035 [Mycena rosella]|uniref:Uncharacterized protein n=1 Tax=Mycena rosella TaxID=1033263 RepID=A0AAD7CHG9_MYCRO|nr:hypothetical protein B0H17DRAFT_1148035 [Mycena rosella]